MNTINFSGFGVPTKTKPKNEAPTAPSGNSATIPATTGDVPLSQLKSQMTAARDAGKLGGLTRVDPAARQRFEQEGEFEVSGTVANKAAKRNANRDGSMWFAIPFQVEGINKIQWASVSDENELPDELTAGIPVNIRVAPNSVNGNLKYYITF